MSFIVGKGGQGGTTSGANGGNTSFSYWAIPLSTGSLYNYGFSANGGAGSTQGAQVGYTNLQMSTTVFAPISYAFIGTTGSTGSATYTNSIGNISSSLYASSVVGGEGGDAANSQKTGGRGGSESSPN